MPRPGSWSASAAAAAAVALTAGWLAVPLARAQSYQTHNLTPDGFWHNRYHMLLSMAAYGDYNTTCPLTFTEASLMQNFPNSTRPPWQVISTFGPTPSGCSGFTVIVPEMNKALIVFKGQYELELSLPIDTVEWADVGLAAPQECGGCTVNQFAVQGYLECKAETNNWQAIRDVYYGAGLVFSITGHGLGGMHSQIAAVDLYAQNIDYYNHAYGNPRVFNPAGAKFYNDRFNGEAGERGIYNNDQMTELIPEGVNYTHAGTPFYYHGWNITAEQPYWNVCWLEDSPDPSHPNITACMPTVWPDTANTTVVQDHYFYMGDVGQCTQGQYADPTIIDPFVTNATGSGELAILASVTSIEQQGQAMATSIAASLSSQSVAQASASAAASGKHESGAAGRTAVGALGATLAAALGAAVLLL